jgi:hypothetical protein
LILLEILRKLNRLNAPVVVSGIAPTCARLDRLGQRGFVRGTSLAVGQRS